jgi:hypothetical protein
MAEVRRSEADHEAALAAVLISPKRRGEIP